MVKTWTRGGLLLAGLGLATLLSGCPGMTGQGGGGATQQPPPGIGPPTGLKSGGVRTLVGATITPPDGQVVMVKIAGGGRTRQASAQVDVYAWNTVRRISITENAVLFEGLNYDGRSPSPVAAPLNKDVNLMLPLLSTQFEWKYEAAPVVVPTPAKGPANAPANAPAIGTAGNKAAGAKTGK